METRVLTVTQDGTRLTPVLVDVRLDPGPPSLGVEGIRLRDLARLATLLRHAYEASDITWPMVVIRARLLPWHRRDFPADAVLALAAGLLAAQTSVDKAGSPAVSVGALGG